MSIVWTLLLLVLATIQVLFIPVTSSAYNHDGLCATVSSQVPWSRYVGQRSGSAPSPTSDMAICQWYRGETCCTRSGTLLLLADQKRQENTLFSAPLTQLPLPLPPFPLFLSQPRPSLTTECAAILNELTCRFCSPDFGRRWTLNYSVETGQLEGSGPSDVCQSWIEVCLHCSCSCSCIAFIYDNDNDDDDDYACIVLLVRPPGGQFH